MRTRRENLLSIFRHEIPEWIPVTAHVDPYNQPNQRGMDPALAARLANVQWADESTILVSRALGVDIMDFYVPPVDVCQHHVTVETECRDDLRLTTWRTPSGDLRQVERYSPETGLWYTIEHQVKDAADLPRLAVVFEDQQITVNPDRLAALHERSRLIGDDGIIIAALPGTPLGQLIRVHAGVEAVGYLWADAPDELQALIAVMAENHLRQYALAAACDGLDALVGMDDTSTTTQSPAMFAACCLPYTERVVEVVHRHGKCYFHHSCGLIHDLLPLYRQTSIDAVHGFTTPPLGDVTIAEGRELLGSKITIIPGFVQLFGNMDDRAAVADSVHAMLDEAGPGDHFLPVLAADPEKTLEDMAFIVEVCRQHEKGRSTACR